MVHVQKRITGRVRHRGVGRDAALFERQSRNVWRVVRGGDEVPGGAGEAAASGGDLPDGDGVQLSRWLDISGRSVRTVVQRVVVEWTRGEHHAAARGTEIRCAGRDESATADFVSGAGTTFGRWNRAVFQGLAGASKFR